jgi:hypothetical protein
LNPNFEVGDIMVIQDHFGLVSMLRHSLFLLRSTYYCVDSLFLFRIPFHG